MCLCASRAAWPSRIANDASQILAVKSGNFRSGPTRLLIWFHLDMGKVGNFDVPFSRETASDSEAFRSITFSCCAFSTVRCPCHDTVSKAEVNENGGKAHYGDGSLADTFVDNSRAF